MTVPHPGTVETQLFTELEDLQRRLVPGSWIGTVEQPDRQEAQPGQRFRGQRHRRRYLADSAAWPAVVFAPSPAGSFM
jgi:hypothetical protein